MVRCRNVSSKRFKERKDRISALPDCLILYILSLLPSTKDAIRTGALSKRWKSLWTLTPTLVFECFHLNQRTCDFIDKTLTQCGRSKLNKFEANIGYDSRFEAQVNGWIRYAMIREVEELSLMLYTSGNDNKCVLDQQLFIGSCFTYLRLGGFIFAPNGSISWKMLRRLCICGGDLDDDLIENILSGSPVLETLELEECYGYTRLHITSKSVKNLVLCGYLNPRSVDHADIIEVIAPGILSLKVQSNLSLWKLLLVDVSSLVETELNYAKYGYCEIIEEEVETELFYAKYGYYERVEKKAEKEMLKGLIQSLDHVKELKVGRCCFKVLSRLKAHGFNFPSNMKLLHDSTSLWFSHSNSFYEDDFSYSDSLDEDDSCDSDPVDKGDFYSD